MIDAKLNAHTGTAMLKVGGEPKDIFVETCMFLESIYDTVCKRLDKEGADLIFEAIKTVIDERIDGTAPDAIEDVIEIDTNIIEAIKRFKEKE